MLDFHVTHKLMCRKCWYSSEQSEDMAMISLALEDESLNVKDMVNSYGVPEIVEFKCDECNGLVGSFQHEFEHLPSVAYQTVWDG